MVEIKPGPELDLAVADAIDYHRYIATGHKEDPDSNDSPAMIGLLYCRESIIERLRCDDPKFPASCIPNFSIDLNTAWAAAEVVGLFDYDILPSYRRCLFRKDSETLCVAGPGLTGEGPTPALAICAAILELKKEKEPQCPSAPRTPMAT